MDPYTNFALSTVQVGSTIIGTAAASKTIILSTGNGALFPGGDGTTQFDVTLWVSGLPTAATAEFIRVTRSGDVLTTVTRGKAPTSALATIAAGWYVMAPMTAGVVDQLVTTLPTTSTRNYILPSSTFDSIGLQSNIAYAVTTGTYTVPVGSTVVRVDRYGHLHAGLNALLAPHPRNNTQTSVADLLYDQLMMRLCTRSIMLTQQGDPADYSGTRFGPEGAAPYAKAGGLVGTNADLTGVGPGISVLQFRGCPAAVPYGGDITTPGGVAEVTAGTLSYTTDEMPRYLTPNTHDKSLDLAVGFRLDFYNTPIGYDGRQPYPQAQLSSSGNWRVGWNAVYNVADNGAKLQIRNDIGQNDVFQLVTKAPVTSGTFTITHYGVPPASPGFVGAGETTSALAYNCTAQQVETALEALTSIGAGTSVGTVNTANSGGNTTVTGTSGNTFLANIVSNDVVTISGNDYVVLSVTSNTVMTAVGNAGTLTGVTCTRRNVACTGGPLNTTPILITFCGLYRNTYFVRPLTSSGSLVGGGYIVVGRSQYAYASGGNKTIATFQHGGPSTFAPTASYYKWLDPAGVTVQELDSTGKMIGTTATAAPGTNDLKLANTAFVTAAVAAGGGGGGPPSGAAGGDLASTYPNPAIKASVSLTGVPTAPTAAVGTSTTQLATTAFARVAGRGDAGAAQRIGIAKATRFYGSSLVDSAGHLTVTSDRWTSKLAQAVGAEVEQNYGVGGSRLLTASATSGWLLTWIHQANRLPTTQGEAPLDVRPPSQPLVGLMHGINDVGTFGTQTGMQNCYRAALEANVRMLRGGFAYNNTSPRFAYLGGGWSAVANLGGSQARASAGSLTWTSSAAGFPGGTLTFYTSTNATANETWRCRAMINGGAYVTTVDATTGYALGASNESVVPITVSGVPAGTGQVVQLDFDNVGAGGFYFLGATLESQWPPIVLLFGQPTLPTMPPSSYPSLTQPMLDGINTTMDTVSGLFGDGKVVYVDMSSMNAVASYWQDDLHYSPSGHAKIADLAVTALAGIGGIPPGYSAGPVVEFAGQPDWSAPPGMSSYDNVAHQTWFSNSIVAGDWGLAASGAPSGTAAGDLAGTYPNPTLKASVGLTGVPTAPTASPGTNTTQLATTAFVAAAGGGPPTGTAAGDLAGTYPNPTLKASVGLTGVPTAPTATVGTNTTQIATTAFVAAAGGGPPSGTAAGDLAGTYPNPAIKASVGLTGVPTAPTAAVDTNTTQLATTAWMIAQSSGATPAPLGAAAAGTSLRYSRADHVHALPAPTPANLFLGAASIWPSTTAGAATNAKVETATNKQNVFVVDFADSVTSFAEGTYAMPVDWDGGTITAKFIWLANDATTNAVMWGIQGRSYGDGDVLDAAWGTAVTVVDANASTANQTRISTATAAVTLAGTPAAGELVQFRLERVGGNVADTLTAAARLLGVQITYTRV